MRNILSPPDSNLFGSHTNDNVELLKAWAGTSLAFAIFQTGGLVYGVSNIGFLLQIFPMTLLIAALTCGIGFVLHELAHRIVARSYGAEAHFVAHNQMLLLSIFISFVGFFLAAPGAVWHRGRLTLQQGGLIALAGPVTNLVLALLFLLLQFMLPASETGGFWYNVARIGYYINAWLGLFNMIPVDPFDGGKVFRWNKVAFGVTAAVGLLLVFGPGRILP